MTVVNTCRNQDMFIPEDNTYNDIRAKSLAQWLNEMEAHEDIAVRGGVKLTRDYVSHLETEIGRLKEELVLKDSYLRKMAEEKRHYSVKEK